MIETEIAAMLAADSAIADITGDRIMDMDFRASDWDNAVNYLGDPITVMGYGGFINPSIVVDGQGINRSLNLRGAGRFMQPVMIWAFTPRGVEGMNNNRILRNRIVRLHEQSVPSRPMVMLQSSVGPMDDGKNLITRVEMHVTFLPQESGDVPPHLQETEP